MEMNKIADVDSYNKQNIKDLRLRFENNQTRDKNKIDKVPKNSKLKAEESVNIEMNKSADGNSYTKQKIQELTLKIKNSQTGDGRDNINKLVIMEMNKIADVDSYNKQNIKDLRMRFENNQTRDKNKIDKVPKKSKSKAEESVNIDMNNSADGNSYTKQKIQELTLKIQNSQTRDGTDNINKFIGAYANMDGGLGNSTDKNKIDEHWNKQQQEKNKMNEILSETKPETEKLENWRNENDKIRNLEEKLEKLNNEIIQLKVEKQTNEKVLNAKVSELKGELEQMRLETNKIQTEAKKVEDNLKMMNNQLNSELEIQKAKKETLETRFSDCDDTLKKSNKLVEQMKLEKERMQTTLDNLKKELEIIKNSFKTEQKSKLTLQEELRELNFDLKQLEWNQQQEICRLRTQHEKAIEEKNKSYYACHNDYEDELTLRCQLELDLENLRHEKDNEINILNNKLLREEYDTKWILSPQFDGQSSEHGTDLDYEDRQVEMLEEEINTWKDKYESENQARMELQEQVEQMTSDLNNMQQRLQLAEHNYRYACQSTRAEQEEAERCRNQRNFAFLAYAMKR